mmetsp:Transcript_966/g.1960  ORF Transcript_966/g.1960 Transcript_966/m.1960 type:complete len:536 (-) Transcript_966:108-1715(-)|eukprot:CAMPEP_0197650552 /NCGR_PEP_ID=MMETSP1338-20131121/31012_1 /TAXON_ID=43686 ORGANISM="Pelagodinium beii, Strain RCC1491" /NCGR_SAMPLE_ID=MMETSP1338 /ASSEMBLY_ACC=CAM_ASM_000754 /LENGTH=535 /DNA_ID=CAMNT_0043224985 /DNA_START=58 /DNA_END=1665 /DNA_ORIENTATION=-
MEAATSVVVEAGSRLASGFRSLRSEGLLCDIVLSAGSAQCAAHQALLAALSKPLRDHILSTSKGQMPPSPELAAPPQPLEIKLENMAAGDEAVEALLCHMYGEKRDGSEDFSQLSAAFQLQALEAPELAVGLQALQAEGLLCDVLLVAGGSHIPAHQAVLAAASSSMRRLLMDGMKQIGLEAQGKRSEALELELRGVQTAEAVKVLLDFLYGRPLADKNLSREACDDILRLAAELNLPDLEERGKVWSQSCQLPTVEEGEDLPDSGEAAETKEEEEEADEEEEEEQAEEALEDTTELQDSSKETAAKKFLSLRIQRFNAKNAVPEPPADALEAAEVAGVLESRHDHKLLQQLVQLFWERPVWIEAALRSAPTLGAGANSERLNRLLPFVAYQWKDGPWQQAFARLGWDPRKEREEATPLQVIDFRDHYFKAEGKNEAKESSEGTEDAFFKKPPTLRSQLYHLDDIQDDIVESLLKTGIEGGAEVTECHRKYGFVSEVYFLFIHERLQLKTNEIREKTKKRQSRVSRTMPRKRARV